MAARETGRAESPAYMGAGDSLSDIIASASINSLFQSRDPLILVWGILGPVTELDEDFIKLSVGGKIIEAPAELAADLRPLVGQDIIIMGRMQGKWQWRRRGGAA